MSMKFGSAKEALLTFLSGIEPYNPFDREFQIQRIPFLIQAKVGEEIGISDMFHFVSNGFGPLDRNIYQLIEQCKEDETIKSVPPNKDFKFWRYEVTEKGYEIGLKKLESMPENIQDYIRRLVRWIYDTPHKTVLGAIYAEHPDLRANSFYPVVEEKRLAS